MSLADRCIHQFDSGAPQPRRAVLSRRPGNAAHAGHEAKCGHSSHGESEYEVVLDWGFSREQLAVCCTCPYYDEHAICKHIWATILAADARGIGPRPARAGSASCRWTRRTTTPTMDSWIDDSMMTTTMTTTIRAPRGKAGRRSPGNKRAGRQGPPPKPKWQQQLTWAAAAADERRHSSSGRSRLRRRRPAKSGMCSTRVSSGDAGKLVLFFLQRETKANGQFGKLKQLSIRPSEAGRLAVAEDAEILNLLLGYHDVEGHELLLRLLAVPRLGGRTAQEHAAVPPAQARGHAAAGAGGATASTRSRSSATCGRWPGTTGRRGGSASTSRPTTRGSAGS